MYVARALRTRGVVFISGRSIFIPVEVIFIPACFESCRMHWPSPADCTVGVGTPSHMNSIIVQALVTHLLLNHC